MGPGSQDRDRARGSASRSREGPDQTWVTGWGTCYLHPNPLPDLAGHCKRLPGSPPSFPSSREEGGARGPALCPVSLRSPRPHTHYWTSSPGKTFPARGRRLSGMRDGAGCANGCVGSTC